MKESTLRQLKKLIEKIEKEEAAEKDSDNLFHLINRFCESKGISLTRFGKIVGNNNSLVFRIRNGAKPRPAMRDKILTFIKDNEND